MFMVLRSAKRDDTLNVVRVSQADVQGTEPPACVRGLRGPALRCGLWVGPEAADDVKVSYHTHVAPPGIVVKSWFYYSLQLYDSVAG